MQYLKNCKKKFLVNLVSFLFGPNDPQLADFGWVPGNWLSSTTGEPKGITQPIIVTPSQTVDWLPHENQVPDSKPRGA